MRRNELSMALRGALVAGALSAGVPERVGAQVKFVSRLLSGSVNHPAAVFVIDLDGDTDLDVLSASAYDDKIAWFENDGSSSSPTFTLRTISLTANGPYAVFAIDLDGDTDIDVLSASWFDDKVAWYENDGSEVFTAHSITTSLDRAYSVFAADLDGDTDIDVVAGSIGFSPNNELVWLENDGSEAFTLRTVSTNTTDVRRITVADVDDDTDLDIVAALNDDGAIAWYENDGAVDPTFTKQVVSNTATGAYGVHVADVDGDNDLDILSASSSSNKIAWYENDGAVEPSFAIRTVSVTAYGARGVFAADIDGDTNLDIVEASGNAFGNRIAWYESDGGADPTFTVRTIVTNFDGDGLYVADLEGDGDADVIAVSRDVDQIRWFQQVAEVSIDDVMIDEAAGTATFTVTLSGTVSGGFSVDYATADDSAEAGSDYTSASGTLNFTGTDGENQTFNVSITDDMVLDTGEQFFANLSNIQGSTNVVIADGQGVGLINDNDSAALVVDPLVAMNEGDSGNTTFTFNVQLNGAVQDSFTVPFSVTPITATAGSDYVDTSGTLNFTGTNLETKTIDVSVIGDAIVEQVAGMGEEFHVTLDTPSNSDVAVSIGMGQIVDDDVASVSIDDVTAAEGDSGTTDFVFTVFVDNAVDSGFDVGFNTNGDTATEGEDLVFQSNTLLFAGNAGEQQTITIKVSGDTKVEGDETFTVDLFLSNTNGRNIVLSDASGLGTITGDDAASIAIDDVTLAEGNSGTTSFTFTTTLTGDVQGGFTVPYSLTAGTAFAGSDYTDTSGTLTFSGTDAETQTLTVDVVGDSVVELDETFTVDLGTPSDAGVSVTDGTGTGTITNDDSARISIDDVTLAEGNSGTTSFTFTATLDAAVDTGVNVDFATADGTASSTSDYTANSGTLSFAGSAGEQQNAVVLVNGDAEVESDETFSLDLSNILAGGRSVSLVDASGLGTIINDDATLSIADVAVGESAGMATLAVTSSGALAGGFSVDFSTADGTATAGADYTASSGTLVFSGGDGESRTFDIPILDDSDAEGSEFFVADLANATNGVVIMNAQATVTITDDDSASISIDDVSVIETDGSADFTVTLTGSVPGGFGVDFATEDDTAIAASDYTATSGTLGFVGTNGEVQTVSVAIANDGTSEGTEQFFLNLSNATGAVTILDGQGIGTIRDPAEPEITVSRAGVGVADGAVDELGEQAVGPVDLVYLVANDGGGDLIISPPTMANPMNVGSFAVIGVPTSPLAGGTTTTMAVRFFISDVGAFSLDLSFGNGDADENPFDMTIQGVGTDTVTFPEPDGLAPGDRLGDSVSVSGNQMATGVPFGGADSGQVVVYQFEGGRLLIDDTLEIPGEVTGQEFGAAVDIEGDLLLIGAPGTESSSTKGGVSALQAALYERLSGEWNLKTTYVSPSGGDDDGFGSSVALDGDTVVIGAPNDGEVASGGGAVYLFNAEGGSEIEPIKLSPTDPSNTGSFGGSVDADDGKIAVGSPTSQVAGAVTGSVSLFDQIADNLQPLAIATGSASSDGDQFGSAVALGDDGLVVGSPGEDTDGENAGAAYLFEFGSSGISEVGRLSPELPEAGAEFGSAVAISSAGIAIGAPAADGGKGAVSLFGPDQGLLETLRANLGQLAFGEAVDYEPEYLIIGAPETVQRTGAATLRFTPNRIFRAGFE